MFYHIKGELCFLDAAFAVVDCGGVGYKLTVSAVTAASLAGEEGKTVKLFTHLAVREDGVELFGFFDYAELEAFRHLTSVSGIGPKAAMAILSILTPTDLAIAVSTEDVRAIAKANGVGNKTAARVVLELKDKLAAELPLAAVKVAATPTGKSALTTQAMKDAHSALSMLGYKATEINEVLKALDASGMTTEQIITAALRRMGK